jgi:hypothetical protein
MSASDPMGEEPLTKKARFDEGRNGDSPLFGVTSEIFIAEVKSAARISYLKTGTTITLCSFDIFLLMGT